MGKGQGFLWGSGMLPPFYPFLVLMSGPGYQCCSVLSRSVMSYSLRPHGLYRVYGILQARILEWAAYPFSRGSSQPRKGTGISCIVGRFFTSWATREAPCSQFYRKKIYAQNNIGRISPQISIAIILSDTIKSYFLFSSAYLSVFFKCSKIRYYCYNF